MRMLNEVYMRAILPLTDRDACTGLHGRFQRYERLERQSLEQNQRAQWEAARKLLTYAYQWSPFYRRRFDEAGLKSGEVSSPADMEKIPPLKRDDIRDNLDELRSRQFQLSDLHQAGSSGTTATPVQILRSTESVREKMAIQWRFNGWAGYLPGEKVFYLWGARQDYPENPSWRWRLYDRYLMRRVWAPTSLFNEAVLESYRQSLNRLRPRLIFAYPTPLALFCEYLRDSGLPCHRPAAAICTAEPLLDHQRTLIESTLDCPLFEHYGSREFGMIAAECESHQGMHINPAAAYVEYIPIKASEVEGLHEILVTDLLNHGMPLIRYKVGDCVLLGSAGPCPCGRGYPRIQRTIGRTTDVFYPPSGIAVPGVALANSRDLRACKGLNKYQIIQETSQDFRVRYVSGPSFEPAHLTLLRNQLTKFLGEEIRWTFEKVEEIERERSGKTRFCISRVDPQTVHPFILHKRA